MAKDKVKNGFAFYLMMFILLVVATFMVIVTIMLFSPQKNILGFKYFSFSDSELWLTTTTSEKSEINFSNINEIQINSSNASVNVIKSNVQNDTVQIINKCIGFAKAEQNTLFTREILLEDGILKINVTEPDGFLFFSKDFQINILVPAEFEDEQGKKIINDEQLKNTKISIVTESGNVNLGLSKSDKEEKTAYNTLNPDQVNVKTNSGTVRINKYFDGIFTSLNLISETGNIISENDISLLDLSENKISTQRGEIAFKNISIKTLLGLPSKLVFNLNVGNGHFKCNEFNGSLSLIVQDGQIEIEKINGDFLANNTKDSITSPKITVNTVTGDVSIPFGNNAKISIGQIDGFANIALYDGSVNLGYLKGLNNNTWVSTKNGSINAVIADTKKGDFHNFESESGNINVTYNNEILSQNVIKSQKGNVDLKIKSGFKFLLEVKNSNGKYIESLSDKVSFEFIDAKEYEMPFGVHDYQGNENRVLIQTDGQVKGFLIPI